ncbi:MAG: tetratricopeptide repeat protein [Myxococcota bacterium]
MGKVLEKLGRKDDAIKAYRDALTIEKDYSDARLALDKLLPPGSEDGQ